MKIKIFCLIIVFLLVLCNFIAIGFESKTTIDDLREKAILEGWTFTIGETSVSGKSIDELCSFSAPENWWEDAKFNIIQPTLALDSSFDWRDLGGVTPPKSQGGCGSCWAFGTVAPLESAIKINEGITVDLSEQWLLSCNRDGWDCDGGWWAHNYHQWKKGTCGGFGAVYEDDFEYEEYEKPCDGPYYHPYIIEDWAFVGSEHGIPEVDAIKQAIETYGPVSAAVRATNDWTYYTGDVWNQNDMGNVNHAITIVGWDDNMGLEGVWIIKNSWGTNWGENGFMYIEYGCSSIGYSACFVNGYRGPQDSDEEKVTLTFNEITNDPNRGDFERIDPIFNKPEWYYRIGAEISNEVKYQYNHNMWTESLGNFGYNSEYTWEPEEEHIFYTDDPTVEFTIKVMENDKFFNEGIILKDDLADVSAYPGGGEKDGAEKENRGAIYHGIYSLKTGELTGDYTSNPDSQGFRTTIGDGDENAKVWFKITDTYIAEIYEPEISINRSTIDFKTISKGTTDTQKFKITNTATFDDNNWADKLTWSATDNKDWITISPTSGLLAGKQSDDVTVTVNTDDLSRNQDYIGQITITSNDKTKYITVKLFVSKTRVRQFTLFDQLLEFIMQKFPIFHKIIYNTFEVV